MLWPLDFERLFEHGGAVHLYLKEFLPGHIWAEVTIFLLGWLIRFLRLFFFLFLFFL